MNDVGGISFGPTIDLLNNAIDGSGREQEQIANNLANVNTPNFRRSTVSFKEALAQSLGTPASPDELALSTDDDRQFNINGAVPPVPYDPKAKVDDTTQMRVDRSNVDLDQEMAQLEQNSGYQQTMAQLLKNQYSWLRESITEQTH
ncbi:MAG: flagellar basal body rod protein FlgB [Candidatus Eremiobacteraeota bacterium]|nr:flagellar basal body rod protein FlgB [Candidatus Eremiobacteraeota bacterium]MBV8331234.1 flagellar basal body rod protein FlgB [Candidatus Eremiobacteraeota bacterium]MBV8582674.1 flagellar basal body rod protein FlgB [Candidatus Eremiobacteraeota bacterium]